MTTYQTSSAQISTLKREYTAQDPHKCMINEDTAAEVNLDRYDEFAAALERHNCFSVEKREHPLKAMVAFYRDTKKTTIKPTLTQPIELTINCLIQTKKG